MPDPAKVRMIAPVRATRPTDARLYAASHKLARRLSRVAGLAESADLIVRAVARTVGVHIASLAMPQGDGRNLSVVATYGYPLALVKHLRLRPGTGIIPAVFES